MKLKIENSIPQLAFGRNIRNIGQIATKRLASATSSTIPDTFQKSHISTYSISAQDQIMGASGFKIPDITITLKEKVNGKKLVQAVEEALELHPIYKTKVGKDKKGLFVWNTNMRKPVILDEKESKNVIYGTDKLANFPWLVSYNKKKIIFTASHMLSDGVGAFSFIKTFLRLYFEKMGRKFPDAGKWDITKHTSALTCDDSYLKYAKLTPKKSVPPKQQLPGTIIPKQFLLEKEREPETYKFVIDKKFIKALAAKSQSSPASVIASMLAKAMQKSTQMEDGVVNIPIPVNCRPHFASHTDRNFLQFAPLSYDVTTFKDASIGTLSNIFKSQLDDSITPDSFIATFKHIKKLTDEMKKNPQIIKQIQSDAIKQEDSKTATICYSHITRTGFPNEFEDLIDNIELDTATPAKSASVCAFAVNFKDKINIKIRHLLKGNSFIKNLTEILNQEKIPFTVEKSLPQRDATCKIF